MKLPRKTTVRRDSVASVFLDLASAHRVRASKMLSEEGELPDELILTLKNDIVNLTKLENLTEKEEEVVGFNISLINLILDKNLEQAPRFKFYTTLDDYGKYGKKEAFMNGGDDHTT